MLVMARGPPHLYIIIDHTRINPPLLLTKNKRIMSVRVFITMVIRQKINTLSIPYSDHPMWGSNPRPQD